LKKAAIEGEEKELLKNIKCENQIGRQNKWKSFSLEKNL